jgi:hypothetical protein
MPHPIPLERFHGYLLGLAVGDALGAHRGIEAIPKGWLGRLENGPRGRDYLRDLADRLHCAHGSPCHAFGRRPASR